MTTMSPARKQLTAKQEAFCLNLFLGLSQREAYVKAGYSPNQLPATLDQHAYELASSAYILARLEELHSKAESDTVGTVIERKQRLTDIYRAQMVDFISPSGEPTLSKDIPHHAAVSEFSITQMSAGEEKVITKRTLKLRDPIAAIQEQNKMERIGAQDTAQGNTNNYYNIAVMSPEGNEMLKRLLSGERTTKELPGG